MRKVIIPARSNETDRQIDKKLKVLKGEAVITYAKEWIRYSTPNKDTEYIAVCVPAFSNGTVHRDEL